MIIGNLGFFILTGCSAANLILVICRVSVTLMWSACSPCINPGRVQADSHSWPLVMSLMVHQANEQCAVPLHEADELASNLTVMLIYSGCNGVSC